MMKLSKGYCLLVAALATSVPLGAAPPTFAENTPFGDVFIEGGLCLSEDAACDSSETLPVDAEIKIKDSVPALYFENTTSSTGDEDEFYIRTGNDEFRIYDHGASGSRDVKMVGFESGAPANSILLNSSGNLGLGTATPGEPLHILRSDGTADLLIEDTAPSVAPRGLLTLKNNGGSYFTLENTDTHDSWYVVHEDNAPGRFLISSTVSSGPKFALTSSGSVTIPGSITTGGPSCSGGCDEVFSPDAQIESIDEHAAAMWNRGHLPAIGPTIPHAPLNVSEKIGGVLNELEKAHIYIEQLHEQSRDKDSRIEKLTARMQRLEALVGATLE